MTTTLVLLSCLVGAPAPTYRPPPPIASVVGTWYMNWGGSECHARFRTDGTYDSDGWEGTWVWDSKTRTLSVDEGLSPWARIRWNARLDGNLFGEMTIVGSDKRNFMSLRKVK